MNRSIQTFSLFIIPIVLAWVWVSMQGYEGLNGQDTHDFLRISKAWTGWADGGERPVVEEHTHGYPITGSFLGALFGGELLPLRLISAGSLLLLLIMLRKLLQSNSNEDRYLSMYLLIAFGCSPFLLRLSMTVMSDLPGIALTVLAYVLVVRWLEKPRPAILLVSLAAMALAIWFRMACAVVVVILVLAMINGRAAGRKKRWLAVGVLSLIAVVVAFMLVPLADWQQRIAGSSIMAHWSVGNLFSTELHSDDGTLRYTVPNLIFIFKVFVHPGFLLIGAPLLLFFRRKDLNTVATRLALVILVIYLLFLAIMPFQNDRILLMASPFVAVLLYPAFLRAIEFLKSKKVKPAWAIALILLAQAGLFVRAAQPFIRSAALERELAEKVNALHPERIYTHGIGAAFGTFCPGVEVTELWYQELDHFDAGAVVVVHPENLQEQWVGHAPAKNWARLQQQGVTIETDIAGGWVVAQVK